MVDVKSYRSKISQSKSTCLFCCKLVGLPCKLPCNNVVNFPFEYTCSMQTIQPIGTEISSNCHDKLKRTFPNLFIY